MAIAKECNDSSGDDYWKQYYWFLALDPKKRMEMDNAAEQRWEDAAKAAGAKSYYDRKYGFN